MTRTADPWRDTDVVDQRAARVAQGTTGIVALLGVCTDCREWEQRLASESEPLLTLDVRERPELARKYGIAVVPTVFRVSSDGAVLKRLAP
ncbi:MAG: hypothetical protein ACRDK5_05815 [Solirubrobacterales bacterium]